MINEQYKAMLRAKSVIRELSEFAVARGQEIGYENVFDFSLGNPSVACPTSYTEAVIQMHQQEDPVALHGYSPSTTIPSVRRAVAQSLNRRFGMTYTEDHIFMTSGAAGALAHALRAVTVPGDVVITFAPFFPEYLPYVEGCGAKLAVVPADTEAFQINVAALEEMLTEDVVAVLINSPNNPSGVVYAKETLQTLAALLEKKEREYGHDIFLISDEPYREIVFDGRRVDYPSRYYHNTLSCYSFSKSLSIPGERIGYVAVHPQCTDAKLLVPMMAQISRGIGHNCPSSAIQLATAKVLEETSDLQVYETNRDLLYDLFVELGFTVVRPGGTFYIFPKALEEDAVAFCQKAKAYDLIFVPSDSFGVPGYVRLAYCLDTEKVKRSLPVIRRFVEEQYPKATVR